MKKFIKSFPYYFILLVFTQLYLFKVEAQINPSTEIRAVWLTTNWQLDWPSNNMSIEEQQRELSSILDQLQAANFNTVFFQVRIRGDVFYRSSIEPMSPFFLRNPRSRNNPPYDPLDYAIRECHKRGLQCHAWLVTFPVGSPRQVQNQGAESIVKKQPLLCKLYQGEWYLDPGNPLTRHYILSLVNEIVSKYDIDGVHFDYIRYPENASRFPDGDTFNRYGKGFNLDEWRRNNINLLVQNIYGEVKRLKPWVQVSCCPLGRYKTLDPRRGTWNAYESVYQDAGLWMAEGYMDAVYPMMYYNEDDFGRHLTEWEKMSNGRFVVPGLGAYRLSLLEGDWKIDDIVNQMNFIRSNFSSGMAFYRAKNILSNVKQIKYILQNYYFKYPAKLPPMTWLKNTPPNPPLNLRVYKEGNYVALEWNAGDNQQQTYTLYRSNSREIDTQNPQNILMTGIHGNKIYLQVNNYDTGVYYAVTASDRFNNESFPSQSAFYIPSYDIQK